MIENKGKRYYTPREMLEIITDEKTELSKAWKKRFPKFQSIVLLDQINRVLNDARRNKEISFISFNKSQHAHKEYYAFTLEDVIDYLVNTYPKKVFDITVHNKGEN